MFKKLNIIKLGAMYYHHNQEDNRKRKNTAHVSTSWGDSETEADYRVGEYRPDTCTASAVVYILYDTDVFLPKYTTDYFTFPVMWITSPVSKLHNNYSYNLFSMVHELSDAIRHVFGWRPIEVYASM